MPRQSQGHAVDSDPKRGSASSAIYLTRNRFATIERGKLHVKDLNNVSLKELSVVLADGKAVKPVDLFSAGVHGTAGKLLLVSSSSHVVLFDTDARQSVGEVAISGPRYVSWSLDSSHLAIISKHNIVIATAKMETVTTIHEMIKIKSGVWECSPSSNSGIFIYSTLNHIKYALRNGDTGIIKTIDQPLYVVRVKGTSIHCLTRDGSVVLIPFDPTEYHFKLALVNKNYDQVMHLIQTSNLMGQSIIGYLQKKGYPEIALQFVKDPKTRFDLAIECGNIDAALEMAKEIDKEQYWTKLGSEALRQGNHQVLEFVYQKTKNYDKLSFLYVCTGNRDKLKKMVKIAEARNDPMSRFQNGTFVGAVQDQIATLLESGQDALAYLAAKTHGLEELAQEILDKNSMSSAPSILPNARLLKPPHVVLKQPESNWPLLNISRNVFEASPVGSERPVLDRRQSSLSVPSPILNDKDMQDVGAWGDEDLDGIDGLGITKKQSVIAKPDLQELDIPEGDGWDIEGDLDISEGMLSPGGVSSVGKGGNAKAVFTPPHPGVSPAVVWTRNSTLAVDHIAAGSFESAMQVCLFLSILINVSSCSIDKLVPSTFHHSRNTSCPSFKLLVPF